jgi:hypothetical protein
LKQKDERKAGDEPAPLENILLVHSPAREVVLEVVRGEKGKMQGKHINPTSERSTCATILVAHGRMFRMLADKQQI